MGADYHIYLHGVGGGSGISDKTKPFSAISSGESNGNSGGSFLTKAKTAYSVANKVASGSFVQTGVAELTKALPVLFVIGVAGKVLDKVLTVGFAHQEEYTGHYENNVNYNNFKTSINNYFHPISTSLYAARQRKQIEKQNKEITQQNRLIGNSVMKDFNIGI